MQTESYLHHNRHSNSPASAHAGTLTLVAKDPVAAEGDPVSVLVPDGADVMVVVPTVSVLWLNTTVDCTDAVTMTTLGPAVSVDGAPAEVVTTNVLVWTVAAGLPPDAAGTVVVAGDDALESGGDVAEDDAGADEEADAEADPPPAGTVVTTPVAIAVATPSVIV